MPIAGRTFDLGVLVAALCFVDDARRAVREVFRVTRKRFAFGLLNSHSLLYLRKGRAGGSGAYCGAHCHTTKECALFDGLSAIKPTVRSAVFLAGGEPIARGIERLISHKLSLGAFVIVAVDVRRPDEIQANGRFRET